MNRGWKTYLKIADIWNDEDASLEQKRDVIVERIKELPQYVEDNDADNFDEELWWIVDELSDVDDEEWFNNVWDAFYDWCDSERVWVEIFSVERKFPS